MHHSGMWGCYEGLNPKFQSLCSKNDAAQAPTPFLDKLSFCGGGTFITFLRINIFQFHFLGRSRGVSCTLWITETRKIYIYTVKKVPPPQNDESFCGQKRGFSPILGEVNFFSGFYGSESTWHTPRPAQKAKFKIMHFLKSYKGTPTTKWQIVILWQKFIILWWGRGLCRFIFRAKTLKFWM